MVVVLCALAGVATAQVREVDSDGDGLTDFQERHKYFTDPQNVDTDGDGVPDGDWRERREYQYTVRTVVQVLRPVTPAYLCDDYQDARVLDETASYVELEVVHYPFNTVVDGIAADGAWRQHTAGMTAWTAPGPTNDWTPRLRTELTAALRSDGIDVAKLDDRALVEQVSQWLCRRAEGHDGFTTFVTAFDARGKPYVPDALRAGAEQNARQRNLTVAEEWARELSAAGMFAQKTRGSCTSSAIYLNGCLRALGMPTRTILCIPVVDAGDDRELEMLRRLQHNEVRVRLLTAIGKLRQSWSSHTFNEVFVGGRWVRLNYDHLGQGIYDRQLYGLITHVATFSDWADARAWETIGQRQKGNGGTDDVFGGHNPYSTIALRDEFGAHCQLANPPYVSPAPHVTALLWCDDRTVRPEIREWFVRRKVTGLVAVVEGLDHDELVEWMAKADKRLELRAAGHRAVPIALDVDHRWDVGDTSYIVVPLDAAAQRAIAADATYTVAPAGDAERACELAPDLRLRPRQ